jgi:hypothetical protein
MRAIANPPVVMISFLQTLDKVDTRQYLVKEAVTAVKELWGVASPAAPGLLKESLALNSALRAITAGGEEYV